MILGGELVVKTVQLIESGTVKTIKQPQKEEKEAPKLFKDICKIDWNQSRKKIFNKIRGLSPYPAAWTILYNGDEQIELKIFKVQKQKELHDFKTGTLMISKRELKVAVKKGFILINELQVSGKRRMQAQDLLNGFTFHENTKVL